MPSTENIPQYQMSHYQPHFTSIPEIREVVDYDLGDTGLGLPLEFEGLYREVSGPQYPRAPSLYSPQQGQQNGLMLEDRWSSFMHNMTLPPEHFIHLSPQAR
jgi:hypothetical protein